MMSSATSIPTGKTGCGESWSFYNPVRIHFGLDVRCQIASAVPQGERFALVCTPQGRQRILRDPGFTALTIRDDLVWADWTEANPDIDGVQYQISTLRGAGVKTVVAVGGGSVIDTAKALAAGLGFASDAPLRQLIVEPSILGNVLPLPLLAVPTTAGTGSEVTPFATLWDHKTKSKMSLAGPNIIPKAAFVDPFLTVGLPEAVTVSAGLDAINQAAESIWNRNANPLSLQFAMMALRQGVAALPRLLESPDDLGARCSMMESSFLAGLAISHTRTALCHSISYPLTSHFGVPHGLACAFTMLGVFDLNKTHDDGRFQQTAQFLQLKDIRDLGDLLNQLMQKMRVRERVCEYLPSLDALQKLVGEMFTPGRVDNNLAPVDRVAILNILKMSYSTGMQAP